MNRIPITIAAFAWAYRKYRQAIGLESFAAWRTVRRCGRLVRYAIRGCVRKATAVRKRERVSLQPS